MARGVDRTVLVVSALAAFFATLFAALVLLDPAPTPDSRSAIASASEQAVPDVSAAPPSISIGDTPTGLAAKPSIPETVPDSTRYQQIRETLERLGVECRDGNCFPD